MRGHVKWKPWSAVLAACIFLLQSCATIVRGTSQKVPVTSNPAGARIIVDGNDMGITPLSLKLAKKRDHLIRIEKEGYVPLEIRALSQGAGGRALFYLGDIIWGLVAAIPGTIMASEGLVLGGMFGQEKAEEEMKSGELLMYLGFAAGWLSSIILDSSLGATRELQPEAVSVTLQKAGEGTPSDVVVITIKDWQNIRNQRGQVSTFNKLMWRLPRQ